MCAFEIFRAGIAARFFFVFLLCAFIHGSIGAMAMKILFELSVCEILFSNISPG